MNKVRPVILWLFCGCFMVFSLVIVGGITRLTHSGLSITEWNVLMGAIPPLNENAWHEAFSKYQQFPEYQIINQGMSMEEFKSIFWWEYLHRLIGRLMGLVFLLPFIYFLIRKRFTSKMTLRLAGVFALGAFQGFLGWFMVASGLVDNPHVSHYRLAAHLITAFFTFAYILWLALDLLHEDHNEQKKNIWFSRLCLIIVTVQIIYGAFVAGLKAGLVYNTFPKMGSSWIPEAVTAMKPFYLNLVENMAGVQFMHRIIGTLVLLIISFGPAMIGFRNFTVSQRRAIIAMQILVSVQFLLGVLTLVYAVPLYLGAVHQIFAFFLFTATIVFLHQSKRNYFQRKDLIR